MLFKKGYNEICLLILILVIAIVVGLVAGKEHFGFYDNLWPSRDTYCEDRGMKKSYMPQKCILLDKCGRVEAWDRYRNCRCVDAKTGLCKVCYPPVNAQMNAVGVYTR